MAKATLLIVEDNESLRSLYQTRLTQDGYLVLAAADAQEAQTLLEFYKIDLLILDIMLPDKSGLDWLSEIRAFPSYSKLPVLLLTSLSEEVGFEKSQELNIHGYLVKDQTTLEQLSQRVKLTLQETSNQKPNS